MTRKKRKCQTKKTIVSKAEDDKAAKVVSKAEDDKAAKVVSRAADNKAAKGGKQGGGHKAAGSKICGAENLVNSWHLFFARTETASLRGSSDTAVVSEDATEKTLVKQAKDLLKTA